jgi:hypothetical protein
MNGGAATSDNGTQRQFSASLQRTPEQLESIATYPEVLPRFR